MSLLDMHSVARLTPSRNGSGGGGGDDASIQRNNLENINRGEIYVRTDRRARNAILLDTQFGSFGMGSLFHSSCVQYKATARCRGISSPATSLSYQWRPTTLRLTR
jgi:hypothetical protein